MICSFLSGTDINFELIFWLQVNYWAEVVCTCLSNSWHASQLNNAGLWLSRFFFFSGIYILNFRRLNKCNIIQYYTYKNCHKKVIAFSNDSLQTMQTRPLKFDLYGYLLPLSFFFFTFLSNPRWQSNWKD